MSKNLISTLFSTALVSIILISGCSDSNQSTNRTSDNKALVQKQNKAEPDNIDVSKYKQGQIIAYFDKDNHTIETPEQAYIYRKYLGKTPEDYYIIQNFYQNSDKKQSDPITVQSTVDFLSRPLKTVEGLVIYWYENGQKMIEWNYLNGKLNGTQIHWYENGQKKSVSHYKNGEDNGLFTEWFENGNKRVEVNRENGAANGLTIEWYEDGSKKAETMWKNGTLEGRNVEWYPNKQKKSEKHYKKNLPIGLWTRWYENGQKKTETYYNSEQNKDGVASYWSETGQLKEQSFYNNGVHGKNIYYKDGQKAKGN